MRVPSAPVAVDPDVLADLPAVSPLVAQLVAALSRADPEFGEVERLVSHEPVVAARVLNVANSAAYTGYPAVTTVRAAVMRLGLVQIRRLALLMTLYNFAPAPRRFHDAFWRHSMSAAQAAAVIAGRVGVEPDVAFLAGLLADLGLLVLVSHHAYEDALVGVARQGSGMPRVLIERYVLGVDHAELGARIAAHWRIPAAISDPIRFHHDVGEAPADVRPVAAVLRLADAVSDTAPCLDLGVDALGADDSAVTVLGLDPEALDDVLDAARAEATVAAAFVPSRA